MEPERRLASQLAGIAVGRVNLLADGLYDVVAAGSGSHVSEEELRRAVEDHGQRLVPIPQAELEALDYPRVPGAERATYEVSVPLWTGEGPSDLVLELRFAETTRQTFKTEVVALHVVPGAHRAYSAKPAPAPSPPRAPEERRLMPAPPERRIPERWRPVFAEIVHRLVIGDHAGLARDGFVAGTDDPSDERIGFWIERYPGKLVDLPDDVWTIADCIRIGQEPNMWWAVIPMWEEDGPSDLSLEAEVRDDGSTIEIKVENVHMM